MWVCVQDCWCLQKTLHYSCSICFHQQRTADPHLLSTSCSRDPFLKQLNEWTVSTNSATPHRFRLCLEESESRSGEPPSISAAAGTEAFYLFITFFIDFIIFVQHIRLLAWTLFQKPFLTVWFISKFCQIRVVFDLYSPQTKIRQHRDDTHSHGGVHNKATSETNSPKNMISGYRKETRRVVCR